MTRLRFPADRTAFVYQGPYTAVLSAPATIGVVVYADSACTMLANILDPDSLGVIAGSTLYPDSGGLIPEFLGPDGLTQLWIRFANSTGAGRRIEPTPLSLIQELSGTGSVAYVYTQTTPATTWTIDHPLPFQPAVTVIDSAGTEQYVDVSYPPNSPGRVVVSASAPFAGKALLT